MNQPAPQVDPANASVRFSLAGKLGVGVVLVGVIGGAFAVWWALTRPSGSRPSGAPISHPGTDSPMLDAQAALNKPVVFPAEDDPGPELVKPSEYVGPQACAECHAARVAEFSKTNHARTCRVPEPSAMPPGFAPGQGTYVTRDPTLRFEMTEKEGSYWHTAVRTTAGKEARFPARIDLVYGAGSADDVYLSWHDDGRLYELPMAWLYPQRQWGAAHFDRNRGGDFSLELTLRCFECHNTWFEHVPGTMNQYRHDNFISGVTCESCHGPGQEHVTFHHENPRAVAAQAVIHPGRLSRERQLEVCTQCHSNFIKHRGPALQYRPGKPLDKYYRSVESRHSEDDHVANQIKYLRESKCFQESDLTCTTCHNPHLPKDAAEAGSIVKSCLGCHQPESCGERNRLPAAVQDKCVSCHMPQHVKINVNFQTADDDYLPPMFRYEHRIAVHPIASKTVLVAWHRSQEDAASRDTAQQLSAELIEHWTTQAQERTQQHRFLAAIAALREALLVDSTPELRTKLRSAVAVQAQLDDDWTLALRQIGEGRGPQAIDTLEALLKTKPDHAKAHGKLGTLYAMANQQDRAVEHLQAVAKYDPDDPYGYGMLGWLAYLQGRGEEALEHYRRADEIEPYDARIAFRQGLVQAKAGMLPDAVNSFRRVLTIDPRHAEACQNLAFALTVQGRPQEALPIALRAASLTEYRNLGILATLAKAYDQCGQKDEAIQTTEQALSVAEATNSNLAPSIRAKLAELRSSAKQAPNKAAPRD